MRYLLTSLVLLSSLGCGDVELPKPASNIATTVDEAKKIARNIASQKCQYVGFENLGILDYGAKRFDCDHGQYTLEFGQTHIFEQEFVWEVGDEVKFRYSDEYLMKPVFIGRARPQETNPAYYLEPIHPIQGIERPMQDRLKELGQEIDEVDKLLATKLKSNPALIDQDKTKEIQRRLEKLKDTYDELYRQLFGSSQPKKELPLARVTVTVTHPPPHKIRGGRILFI